MNPVPCCVLSWCSRLISPRFVFTAALIISLVGRIILGAVRLRVVTIFSVIGLERVLGRFAVVVFFVWHLVARLRRLSVIGCHLRSWRCPRLHPYRRAPCTGTESQQVNAKPLVDDGDEAAVLELNDVFRCGVCHIVRSTGFVKESTRSKPLRRHQTARDTRARFAWGHPDVARSRAFEPATSQP